VTGAVFRRNNKQQMGGAFPQQSFGRSSARILMWLCGAEQETFTRRSIGSPLESAPGVAGPGGDV